ncbi:BON domain-containing protein [Oxalobacter vibrioformis]|uniref:BON domain-containing protein n=1 Tax=Oxalobacter vibrioformis TaxID=933080 RepID=A0A9E9LVL3_9BURK|nr:BON domain-containing protein [Oxalobacter vibrioformis]WAW09086.1 BON domain-containing protein [Oxalobacter vibrioformis]
MSKESTAVTRWKRLLGICLLCSTAALVLQACMPTVIVGGGVAGTMAASDRRTFGTQTEDRTIGFKGESVADSIVGSQGHVSVTSFNRMVLITGEVPNEGMKTRVASEVKQIPNVRNIINELEIAAPSSLSSRSSDSLITAKVAASFLNTDGLYANSLKTVTERGNVYLMGRVTEREGNLAAEVARGVPGVQRVIKVFEHISEEELDQMKAQDVSAAEATRSDQDGEEYR